MGFQEPMMSWRSGHLRNTKEMMSKHAGFICIVFMDVRAGSIMKWEMPTFTFIAKERRLKPRTNCAPCIPAEKPSGVLTLTVTHFEIFIGSFKVASWRYSSGLVFETMM